MSNGLNSSNNTETNGENNVTCTVINSSANIRIEDTECNGFNVSNDDNSTSITTTADSNTTTTIIKGNDNSFYESNGTVEVSENGDQVASTVTISLVNRAVNGTNTCNGTAVSSTCTIDHNGLVVEDLDEISQLKQEPPQSSIVQQQPVHRQPYHHQSLLQRHHNNGDDKENRHCTLLAMNGYHHHQNGAGNDVQLFPDAPTTPKVLRKVAPMYCNFKNVTTMTSPSTTTSHNNGTAVVLDDTNGGQHEADTSASSDVLSPRNGVTVTVTINGDDRHAPTTRIHICPPD